MCAIFGIIGDYNKKDALSALNLMSHRGVDATNYSTCKDVFFAHNLLNINNSRTSQPLHVKDIMITFNGEIYNYKALAKELHVEQLSEIDVLHVAYKRWGVDFVKKVKGMFAIAIYDRGELYLFRDSVGKKPLFYYHDSNKFIFASELKAIKPFLKQKRLSSDALLSYLSFSTPTPPHTFFDGVFKLPSASYLKFSNSKIEIVEYYNILDSEVIYEHENLELHVETLLKNSIFTRCESQTKKALLLSGGVDSSLLAAMAKKMSLNFHAYTLGYKEKNSHDETIFAKEVASYLGIKHSVVQYGKSDFFETIEDVFEHLDEPLNDPSTIPLEYLFKQISSDGYKVALSGEGSDELFYGYRQYGEYYDIEQLSSLKHKNWLKKYLNSFPTQHREWEWYRRVFSDELLFRTSSEVFTDIQKNRALTKSVDENGSMNYLNSYYDKFINSRYKDMLSWYSYIDLKLHVGENFLTKLDRVSMSNGVEARTPYLDLEFMNRVFSLSNELKFSTSKSKPLLKNIAQHYLPQTIVNRKKKGFSYPYMKWLVENNSLEIIKSVNKDTLLFKKDYIDGLILGANRGKFKNHIYALYNLSHWLKREIL
ncbi:MAG: asparagine synthase (glutamine-hydrolyzing) [Campylobacterota bacterium]|nr:asparagine synthase (glutamine-hydrolyzing) [Campylobacterota bacterium]